MRDQELHDLLHERVADVTMPDVSDAAWDAGRRRRRRRTTGAVAGAVAAVVVTAVVANGGAGLDRSGPVPPASRVPSPTPSPTPDRTAARDTTRPDGHFRGWRVYRGPLVDQEATLPRAASPFPSAVDLSVPAPDVTDRPIGSALAAFAVSEEAGGTRLLLLTRDGDLRSVDTSRVAPLDDGAGDDVSVARDTLLSPTGEYLAFPQAHSVQVLTLATGTWRTIDTGTAVTTTAQWDGVTDLWLPSTSQGGSGPLYSVTDGTRVGSRQLAPATGPFGDGDGASPYGRWLLGPGGTAQSWARVDGLPGAGGRASQVVLAAGRTRASNALLVLGEATPAHEHPRPDFCCGVAFWLDEDVVVYGSRMHPGRLVAWRVGTHDFRQVTTIVGYDPDRQFVDASYAALWR